MKTLIAALILLVTSSAQALTIPYEHQEGYRFTGRYGWRYAYNIGLVDDTLKINVNLRLLGTPAPQDLRDQWESQIETAWSTDRFAVPVLFDVDWVTAGEDNFVNVIDGVGRWSMINWYMGGWSAAAHEFGHMVSLYDEYVGGAVNPETRLTGTGGIMDNSFGPTLDAYYDPFLSWYEAKITSLPHDTEPVPEPGTIVLLFAGITSLLILKKRSTV